MKTLVEKLKNYNRWRRGDETVPQPHPQEVGEMIDQAIEALEDYLKQKEGEKEHPKQLSDIMNKVQSFTHICEACNGDGVLDKRHGFAYGSSIMPVLWWRVRKGGRKMKLKDLVGLHDLSGVDITTGKDGCNVVRFVLDGKTYKATEDPGDGYRSYLERLDVTDEKVTNNFPPHKVVGTMKGPGWYEHDIILFIDIVTGKVVLEVGTEDVSDYYPCCVLRWHPENLAINIGK